MNIYQDYQDELDRLSEQGNLRSLPHAVYQGKWVVRDGRKMCNLSSNDYLGLAADVSLRDEFLNMVEVEELLFSASSSRLLTGNFSVYDTLEDELAALYGAGAALVVGSGYHLNTGVLPAVADAQTLILADKLVHASLIDGIRLSAARCIRYRHQDMEQLEMLLQKYHAAYSRIILVTESVFSMDGDVTDLSCLVAMKKRYPQVMLYVDEAHGVGVYGECGLGIAEEQGCIREIDFLCGTLGKALASVGAFVICSKVMKDYLVNRMRTLIFTTALPPVNISWTLFVVRRLSEWKSRRQHLYRLSEKLRHAIIQSGKSCDSDSHIVPFTLGTSELAIEKAMNMQHKGFYVLPVRPPTVPEGTSRLRFSLTAALSEPEVDALIQALLQ